MCLTIRSTPQQECIMTCYIYYSFPVCIIKHFLHIQIPLTFLIPSHNISYYFLFATPLFHGIVISLFFRLSVWDSISYSCENNREERSVHQFCINYLCCQYSLGISCSTVVVCWTAGQYVEQSILHRGHDSQHLITPGCTQLNIALQCRIMV